MKKKELIVIKLTLQWTFSNLVINFNKNKRKARKCIYIFYHFPYLS